MQEPFGELGGAGGGYVPVDAGAWLAHALAVYFGHYRHPAAREAAAGLLLPPVLTHAALVAELARLVVGTGGAQPASAARLSTGAPEAAGALAAFLARSDAS